MTIEHFLADPPNVRDANDSRWIAVPRGMIPTLERRARHQQNIPRPDPKLVATEHGGYQVHLWGEIGEWAVAHKLGLPLHRLYAEGNDGRVDFDLPEGRTLAVKATPHDGGHLLFRRMEDFQTDIAALVYVHRTRFEAHVRGWITRRRFRELSEPFTRGRLGTEVCVRSDALSPIGLLARWIEDRRTP